MSWAWRNQSSEIELEDDVLKSSECHLLKCIRDFLQPFYQVTMNTEGRMHTLERVLPTMEFLLNHYEKAFITFENDNFILTALDAEYDKLLKYFNKHERNSAYIAAVMLNPARK